MCWDWSIYLIICSLCLVTSGMVWYAPCDRMNRMNDRVPLCQMSRRHSRRTRMNPLFSAEKMSIDRAWQRMNWMPNESWMIECWMNPLIYVPGLDVLSFVDQSICPVPSRPLREAFYYQHRRPLSTHCLWPSILFYFLWLRSEWASPHFLRKGPFEILSVIGLESNRIGVWPHWGLPFMISRPDAVWWVMKRFDVNACSNLPRCLICWILFNMILRGSSPPVVICIVYQSKSLDAD